MKDNLIILLILFSVLFSGKLISQENKLKDNVRTFINLLDYLRTDYHNSVKNGKVINANEYNEMNEFSAKTIHLFNQFSGKINFGSILEIKGNLEKLKKLVEAKADQEDVYNIVNKIKSKIIKLNIISVSPVHWPDILNGKKIFKTSCSSCHGTNGDGNGVLSKNLNPKPTNLLNDTFMDAISPFQIYNTIKLGISGTSMPPFNLLSDKEVWDVAFYVGSLRYKNKYKLTQDSLFRIYNIVVGKTSLDEISTLPDKILITKFKANNKLDTLYLAALRLHSAQKSRILSIELAASYLNDVQGLYKNNEYEKASAKALSAYLEGIEPFEQQLQTMNSYLKNELESIMYRLRSDIKDRKPLEIIKEDISKAKTLINDAASVLGDKDFTFWFAFLMAASIILREGIEAFLIIITILGVLKSINASDAIKWVHGGWIFALIAGIISMFFVNMVISFGAQSRELMEGIGSLIAVILLLYIGFWLHGKTEAKKWKDFVENKIIKLVNGKNMIGLAIVSFVVVFREAFESVIFLSAVNLEINQSSQNGIYLGAISSLILVLALAWIAVRFTAKLPVMKLFKYSAIIIAVLSVIIAGNGIRAFQESGYSSVTNLPIHFNVSFLGIYPTLETIAAQIIVLTITIVLWTYSKKISLKT
ncbi:MAG TPA: c-type cytochrome [Ignavibacteria bacterium]|nr:c-type cytochrome [Ignavibacteria bacterium]